MRSLKSTFLKPTHMRIPTVYLSFKADSTYSQIDAVNSMKRCVDAIRCWMIKDKLCLNERKSKTDLHGLPMCFFLVALHYQMPSSYILLLQACLSEIYLFCRIGGLLKIFFQRRLIFYETPVCHQCLFKILCRWLICCNETH